MARNDKDNAIITIIAPMVWACDLFAGSVHAWHVALLMVIIIIVIVWLQQGRVLGIKIPPYVSLYLEGLRKC